MPRGRQLSASVYVEPRAIGNVTQEFFRHNQSKKQLLILTKKAWFIQTKPSYKQPTF